MEPRSQEADAYYNFTLTRSVYENYIPDGESEKDEPQSSNSLSNGE